MSATDAALSIETRIEMNDGNRIPILGYGVFQVEEGAGCKEAVLTALEAGYRHIDTAWIYGNEASVGSAIAASGLPREEIFLTTKTAFDHSAPKIRSVFAESLEKLQTDYVDMLLIHWPFADEQIPEAWSTLQEFQKQGTCKSIGVSNFTVRRFEEAFLPNVSSIPAMNQIEMHAFNAQQELVSYCKQKGMAITAYSPLAQAQRLSDETLVSIGSAHGKTPAQVMIRWLLQQGVVTIPKSTTPSRIRENADVFDFDLTVDDMTRLNQLDEELYVLEWRPKGYY